MCYGLTIFHKTGYQLSRITPAHRAHVAIEFLRRQTPPFIPPDLWPANSPDLNPADYCIWGRVQQCVYQKPVKDVDELKQRLVEVWSGLRQTVVDDAIDKWIRRLRACVRVKGQHFEHLLQLLTLMLLINSSFNFKRWRYNI